jgi:branched-chain amino acid transport system substrate-binding protein
LALVLWLAGCATDAKKSDPPLKIGAVFSETGRYAFVGKPPAEVLRHLQQAGLSFELHDTGGERQKCLAALQKMAADPTVIGVVGPATVDETLAVVEASPHLRLPCLATSASDRQQKTDPWVFRLPISNYHMAHQICDYSARQGWSELALIYVDSAFGRAGQREMEGQAAKFGLRLISQQKAPDRLPEAAQADQWIQRAQAAHPQALVIWWSGAGAGELTLAARRCRLDQPLLHSGGIAGNEFLDQVGSAGEGVLFPGAPLLVPQSLPAQHPQSEPLQRFRQFAQEKGLAPSTFAGYGWDGAQLLLQALQEVGPSREKIRAYLENLQEQAAVSGVYSFSPTDHNGLSHNSFLMIEIQGGSWHPATP